MRQNKLVNLMEIAETVAKRSHDIHTQVGALLINNASGAILATGYNGFVRDAPDNLLPTDKVEKHEYMVHAEQNLIANCARHGISMNDCSVICTLSPCLLCKRLLWNCGITKVIVKNCYKDFEESQNMKDIRITQTIDKHSGYLILTYEAQKEKSEKRKRVYKKLKDTT